MRTAALALVLLGAASAVTYTNVVSHDGSTTMTYTGGLPGLPKGTKMIEYGPARPEDYDG